MQEKIKSRDISVVVQGPIHKRRTKKTLHSIRKNLPDAEIILSTWEGSSVDSLEYDILILNKDPGAICQTNFRHKTIYNNLNRMIISTNNALKQVNRKYTLKLRTDAYIDNLGFLSAFDLFPERCERYKLFSKRILASTLFSRISINKYGNKTELPFHLSDWWFFGLTEDVKKLLLSSELTQEPYFSNYFEYPENKDKNSVYEKFTWQFAPEQYLAYSCFSKYYDDIRMEDCSDITDLINRKSQICMVNNFIFLEYKQSGIRSLKYTCSKNELLAGNQYLDLYSFYRFESEYKKYCDSSYIISKPPVIFDDKLGFEFLRFYKHLFKLIDKETPFITRLEQLFFGIPLSGIMLIVGLIKILIKKR